MRKAPMRRLSEDERRFLEGVWPAAEAVAARYERAYGDRDFRGAVALALCRYVTTYDPALADPCRWAIIQAHYACRKARRRMPFDSLDSYGPGGTPYRHFAEELGRPDPEPEGMLLEGLVPAQAEVLRRYALGGESLGDIARDMGLSKSRVARLKDAACARLRLVLAGRA